MGSSRVRVSGVRVRDRCPPDGEKLVLVLVHCTNTPG